MLLVGVALADPNVYFMERFETGKGIRVLCFVGAVWVVKSVFKQLKAC